MYSLRDYGAMIADAGRFNAYANAIARAVRPGDTVAEIGCGPGVFSLLACRAGARRVFAIESESCIQFARELAAANGFTDRIEFFQSDSRKTELPERVNVIVSDIRGVLPLYGHAIPSLEDARERLLATGGILIPQRDILKAAVIEAEEYYSRLMTPWRESVPELDLSPAMLPILNEFYRGSFKKDQLLTEAQDWGLLDYTMGVGKRVTAELHFHAVRDGVAHGVCLWFEAALFENIGYSSGPAPADSVHGQLLLATTGKNDTTQESKVAGRLASKPRIGPHVVPTATDKPESRTLRSDLHGAIFAPIRSTQFEVVPWRMARSARVRLSLS